MKRAPVRHAVEYAFYLAAKGFLRALPHASSRRLGHGLGELAHLAGGSKRRLALANVKRALPELSEAERRRVVRDCFRHFGGHFAELLSASRFALEDVEERFTVEGWDHVRALEDAGRNYFLTTGHFGAWEMALYPLSLRVRNLQGVVRPPDNPHVDRDLRRMRQRFGLELIGKAGAAHRMLNAHRRGARVAIVIDQHVRPSAGIRVPFFGHPAWTSPVLAFLSIHTGAAVVHFSCLPEDGGRYRLRLRPPIEPEGRGDDAQAALTRRYLEEVERDVRERPELWLWMHRRWRE